MCSSGPSFGLLSLSLPLHSPPTPGFVTFISFILFGLIPLIGYVIFSSTGMNDFQLFIVAIVLTAITLFFLGAVKVCLFACLASWLGGWWCRGLAVISSPLQMLTFFPPTIRVMSPTKSGTGVA